MAEGQKEVQGVSAPNKIAQPQSTETTANPTVKPAQTNSVSQAPNPKASNVQPVTPPVASKPTPAKAPEPSMQAPTQRTQAAPGSQLSQTAAAPAAPIHSFVRKIGTTYSVLILAILIVVACLFIFLTVEKVVSENTFRNREPRTGSSVDTTVVVNPDDTADVINETHCLGYQCFLDRFKECKRAALSLKIDEETSRYYEIIGPSVGMCKVLIRAIADSDEKLVGKEMICLYDSNFDFTVQIEHTENCKGELKDLMKKVGGGGGGAGAAGGSGGDSGGDDSRFINFDVDIGIDIISEKNLYLVGEPVGSLTYVINNNAGGFEGTLVAVYSKLGVTNTFEQLIYKDIPNGETRIPDHNKAFNINEYSFRAPLTAFEEVGVYSFELYLYSCELLEEHLNESCGTHLGYEEIKTVPYIKKSSKSITVIEE